MPFLATERTKTYGQRPGGESDLALGPFWRLVERAVALDDRGQLAPELRPWQMRWKPRTVNCRGEGRSSGVDVPVVIDVG